MWSNYSKIYAIGAKHQVEKEKIRVKLKLYETCLIPVLLYEFEAWGKIDEDEMNETEKVQWKALKTIFNLPRSTS